jgi:hypothetical protein
MQRWQSNFNFINELAFAEKITAYFDQKAAFVCNLDNKRTFLFPTLPTDDELSCIVEDVANCPKYEKLPDNTYFYWPDILGFEAAHSEIYQSPVATEASGDIGTETKNDVGRRDKQITFICNTASELQYMDLMAIPEGGKTAIKKECLKNTALFTDDGFKKAWQEANNRKLISMQDKEKYL